MSNTALDRTLIRGLPLFERMDSAALDDALSRATSQRYAPGDVVFEQGETADLFCHLALPLFRFAGSLKGNFPIETGFVLSALIPAKAGIHPAAGR